MTAQVKRYNRSIGDRSMGYRTNKEVKFMKVALLGLFMVMQVYGDGEVWMYDGDQVNLDNFAVTAYEFNGTNVIENDPAVEYDTENQTHVYGDGDFAVYNKDHVNLDKFAVKVYESNCTDFIKIDPVFEYAYGTKIESDIYYDVVGNFNQFEMKKYESKNMYVIEEDDTENDTDTNFMEIVSMGFKVMFCILFIYCIYHIIQNNFFKKLFGKLRRPRSKFLTYMFLILFIIVCIHSSSDEENKSEKKPKYTNLQKGRSQTAKVLYKETGMKNKLITHTMSQNSSQKDTVKDDDYKDLISGDKITKDKKTVKTKQVNKFEGNNNPKNKAGMKCKWCWWFSYCRRNKNSHDEELLDNYKEENSCYCCMDVGYDNTLKQRKKNQKEFGCDLLHSRPCCNNCYRKLEKDAELFGIPKCPICRSSLARLPLVGPAIGYMASFFPFLKRFTIPFLEIYGAYISRGIINVPTPLRKKRIGESWSNYLPEFIWYHKTKFILYPITSFLMILYVFRLLPFKFLTVFFSFLFVNTLSAIIGIIAVRVMMSIGNVKYDELGIERIKFTGTIFYGTFLSFFGFWSGVFSCWSIIGGILAVILFLIFPWVLYFELLMFLGSIFYKFVIIGKDYITKRNSTILMTTGIASIMMFPYKIHACQMYPNIYSCNLGEGEEYVMSHIMINHLLDFLASLWEFIVLYYQWPKMLFCHMHPNSIHCLSNGE